jgi:hypothetical protein
MSWGSFTGMWWCHGKKLATSSAFGCCKAISTMVRTLIIMVACTGACKPVLKPRQDSWQDRAASSVGVLLVRWQKHYCFWHPTH